MSNPNAASLRETINPELNDNLSTSERLDKILEWAKKNKNPLFNGSDKLPHFSYQYSITKFANKTPSEDLDLLFDDGKQYKLHYDFNCKPTRYDFYDYQVGATSLNNKHHYNLQDIEADPDAMDVINKVYFTMKKEYSQNKIFTAAEKNYDNCSNCSSFIRDITAQCQ